jgi:predicted nucleic acid-binding protein
VPLTLIAVVDACVLVPAALCDFLLRSAAADLYQLAWSDDILAEVQRTLIADLGKSLQQAERRIEAMKRAFPTAIVTSHHALISAMPTEVHTKDRHVLAAAVAAGAAVIVTRNLRDFPAAALSPLGIEAQSPDDFLLHLYDLGEETLKAVVIKQAGALRNPPMTPRDVAKALRPDAPRLAAKIETVLPA